MKDALQRTGDIRVLGDVVANELKAVVADEVSDIVGASRNEIVEANNGVPLVQEAIAKVGTEETGRPRYENSHIVPPRPIE